MAHCSAIPVGAWWYSARSVNENASEGTQPHAAIGSGSLREGRFADATVWRRLSRLGRQSDLGANRIRPRWRAFVVWCGNRGDPTIGSDARDARGTRTDDQGKPNSETLPRVANQGRKRIWSTRTQTFPAAWSAFDKGGALLD